MAKLEDLPAEAGFVLAACAAVHGASDGEDRAIRLLDASFDWSGAIELARAHGVLPSLYRFLAAHPSLVPSRLMRELRFDCEENTLRNRRLARELVRLSALLEARAITPIVFKGPVLAQLAYGDVGGRSFLDLDLLVSRDQVGRARAILDANGFAPHETGPETLGGGFFQASAHPFVNPATGTAVDLHWALTPSYFPFAPDAEVVRRRSIRLRLEEGEVATLAPHDHLLFICVHGAKHGWSLLRMITDVAALLGAEQPFDWTALCAEAEERGSLSMLLLGVTLAHDALGARLPPAMVDRARCDPIAKTLAPRLLAALFTPGAGARVSFFHDWIVPLRAINSRRARFAYFMGRAFAPTFDDWRFRPLPEPLFSLYYLLRPCRLMIQQTPRLLSALGAGLYPHKDRSRG